MIVSIILMSLGAIASGIFIASKVTNYSLKTIIFKTIASLFFVALGIYLVIIKQGHVAFKVLVLLGLIFGMLGDVFLGFKYITEGKVKKFWILAGMFAFAFGHISYVLGLFLEFYIPGNVIFAILPFVTAICLCCVYMVVARKVGINFGKKMLPFGLFYLACLTSMVSTSLYMVFSRSAGYAAAPVITGMGLICWVLVISVPPFLRKSTYLAASRISNEMITSA